MNLMNLPNFPIDKSYLVGGWLASAFWGAFTVVMCVWAISFSRNKTAKTNIVFPVALVFMYTLATVHISLVLARLIEAFIVHVNDEGAVMYLADIGQPLNRAKDMVYVSLIFFGDSVLIWRCFIVWKKNLYVIAVPACMVLGTAISGYGAIGQYFLPNPYVPRTVRWAQGMLAISMVTNILVTGLTAGRIYYYARQLNGLESSKTHRRNPYRSVILIVVESGVFMAISKIIEFVLFQLAPNDGLDGLNALYIPMDCMPQIMGICPAFIMLAVSTGLSSSGTEGYNVDNTQSGPRSDGQVSKEVRLGMVFSERRTANETDTTASSGQFGDLKSSREAMMADAV